MSKRKQPVTSILAHDSIKPLKQVMFDKIIAGLKKMRIGGTFDEISDCIGLKPSQVWKRLSDLRDNGVVFNTGITRLSASGRQASVWQLSDHPDMENKPVIPTPATPKVKPPTPPKNNNGTQYVQNDLFSL